MSKIGYKLFREKRGHLFPLYVLSEKETPIGEWLEAEAGELQPNGKVKAKLGNGLCFRPGWHLSTLPFANHIGIKKDGVIVAQHPDTIWCEVEYSDDIDYQEKANENGTNRHGKVIPAKAYLKEIPVNGFYRFKTNPNMFGEWIIAGAIKVNRVLSHEEVVEICRESGIEAQAVA